MQREFVTASPLEYRGQLCAHQSSLPGSLLTGKGTKYKGFKGVLEQRCWGDLGGTWGTSPAKHLQAVEPLHLPLKRGEIQHSSNPAYLFVIETRVRGV